MKPYIDVCDEIKAEAMKKFDELLEDGDKITGTELFGELSFTIDDEP